MAIAIYIVSTGDAFVVFCFVQHRHALSFTSDWQVESLLIDHVAKLCGRSVQKRAKPQQARCNAIHRMAVYGP